MSLKTFHNNDDQCVIIAEDLPKASLLGKFQQVIADIAGVYPKAILVGAAAAAQYIGSSNNPRITLDVDILLEEKDFSDFLADEIPGQTLTALETCFDDSDSVNHSLKHKETGIYVDLLSLESKPIRKNLVRNILENRKNATHRLKVLGRFIDILKPEYLIAMKLNRFFKKPKSERGQCDRIDILKLLKAQGNNVMAPDHEIITTVCNRNEAACYLTLLDEFETRKSE
jgi:hypothetical protein